MGGGTVCLHNSLSLFKPKRNVSPEALNTGVSYVSGVFWSVFSSNVMKVVLGKSVCIFLNIIENSLLAHVLVYILGAKYAPWFTINVIFIRVFLLDVCDRMLA